jgi:hypothetical protein
MYSNDTKQLLDEIKHIQSENKELTDILKSIKQYLTSKTLHNSLNIIYKLIRDNYCNIYPKIKLDINKGDVSSEINMKLNTIMFLSPEDRTYIQNTLTMLYKVKATYNSNTIQLYIHKEKDDMEEVVIHRIVSKLFTLIDLFTKNTNTTFNIYIWLSDLKKKTPGKEGIKHEHHHSKTFRAQHINSGATVHNLIEESVELFIWRKEEIEKVLLHEMIHTLKLDFMDYPEDLKRVFVNEFNIPNHITLRLGEAYVETWAVILNTIFITFTQNTKLPIKEQCNIDSPEFYNLFAMEIYFTLLQSSKILYHFGYNCIEGCAIPFKSTEINGDNFKQETSVFSYYLVKGGILMNLDKFFKFCCTNNTRLLQFMKSQLNFKELNKVFIYSAKNNKLLERILQINKFFRNKLNYSLFENTMRMTLYELKI